MHSLSFLKVRLQNMISASYRMLPSRNTSIILYNFLSDLSRICTLQQASRDFRTACLKLYSDTKYEKPIAICTVMSASCSILKGKASLQTGGQESKKIQLKWNRIISSVRCLPSWLKIRLHRQYPLHI